MSKKIIKAVLYLLLLWIMVTFIFIGIRGIWSAGIAVIGSTLLGMISFGSLSYILWESFYKLVTDKGHTGSKKNSTAASKPRHKLKTPRAVGGALFFCVSVYFILILLCDSAAIVSGKFSTTTGTVENIHYQSAKGGGYYKGNVNGIEFSIPDSFYEGENVEITYLPMSKIIIRYYQK